MTREQILKTVRDMLEDDDSAIGWNHVIEYLDGAICELVTETVHIATNMTIERLQQKLNDELL
jgi:hypothetical protein